MTFRIHGMALLMGSILISSQYGRAGGPTSAKDSIPTLTVCEALSHPLQYDGKMVRVRGRVGATEEGASFLGDACPGIYVTQGKIWPSAIAWTSPTQLDNIVHPVDFAFDEHTNEARDRQYLQLRKHLPDRCIQYTYTGMFEIWSEKNSMKTDPKGHRYQILGFGHLNAAPAQLVLKSADGVSASLNCKKK